MFLDKEKKSDYITQKTTENSRYGSVTHNEKKRTDKC